MSSESRESSRDHAEIPSDADSIVERRSYERALVSIDVVVTPLDHEFKPTRYPFPARTKDIAANSIGIFHSTQFRSTFLVTTIANANGEDRDLLFRVVRTSEGHGGEFFTAGILVARLDEAK